MGRFWTELAEKGFSKKIGVEILPILLAGIRVGVAKHPRLGLQRTATPTASNFLRFRTQGLQTRKAERFGVENARNPIA